MKKLERSLSLSSVVAIAIGGMLGSGIFVLPGLAAAKTGPSIWLAYLVAGLCVLPTALSKSELATAMPTSGGSYVYIDRAFGPIIGTISGLGLWFSLLLKSAFALVGFSAYLFVLADLPLKPMSLALLGVIVLLNILGVKKVGQAQIFIVSLSLLGLTLAAFAGSLELNPRNFQDAFPEGNGGFWAAVGFVFVSYAGVTKVAAIAEEIKNPGRNVPKAMLLALGLISCIYGLVVFVMVGNIPLDELSKDLHPIYTLAQKLGGNIAGIAAAILGIITLTSMANSGILAASRFPFAMSRNHLLPPFLKHIHQKYMTPVPCILLTGLVMGLVIGFLDVEKIAKLASAFMVFMFIAVNMAVIVFRETDVQWYNPKYRSPMYPWVQLFGIFSGTFLLILLGTLALFGALGLSLLGVLVFFIYGNKHTHRKGIMKLYSRKALLLFLAGRRSKTQALSKIQEEVTFPSTEDLLYESDDITDEAAVVAPLLGTENSPESIVELGAALTKGGKLQVVHISEVPYQTILDAMLTDSPYVSSLNRRITAMAEEKQLNIEFDAVVTHELANTVHEISERSLCKWIVMGWDGRTDHSIFVNNPIRWITSNLSCHLALFRDNGVRYIRKILIYIDAGADEAFLIHTAVQLVEAYKAELSIIEVLPKATSEADILIHKTRIQELCRPHKIKIDHLLIFQDDAIEAIIQASVAYDLLLLGSNQNKHLAKYIFGSKKDQLIEKATCSVLYLSSSNISQLPLAGETKALKEN